MPHRSVGRPISGGSFDRLYTRISQLMEISSQTPAAPAQRVIHTAQLIAAMLKSNGHVSDLIFSPGRAPQIEVSGQLVELKYKGLECLSAADTKSIAYDIMGENEHPLRKLDSD